MPNQTTVTLVNGVPTAPSGTVSTIDALMADGGQATIGAIADAAVTAGATGSVSAKLRSLSRDIGSLVTAWGSTLLDFGLGTGGSRTQRVIVDSSQFGPAGPGIMAAGALVTIASDQTPVKVTPGVSATANGATASRILATASNNLTSVKASAGQLYTIDVFNVAAYNVFLKIYNKASAPVVAGDTPIMTIPIQAGGGYSKTWPMGLPFATGIAYAIVKLQADTDATNVVAGDLTGNIVWI